MLDNTLYVFSVFVIILIPILIPIILYKGKDRLTEKNLKPYKLEENLKHTRYTDTETIKKKI